MYYKWIILMIHSTIKIGEIWVIPLHILPNNLKNHIPIIFYNHPNNIFHHHNILKLLISTHILLCHTCTWHIHIVSLFIQHHQQIPSVIIKLVCLNHMHIQSTIKKSKNLCINDQEVRDISIWKVISIYRV